MDWPRTARGTRAGRAPVLPSKDPFFTPPPASEHAEPGTVCGPATSSWAFGLIPQKVKATQLLYRTTDMNGMPLATVTTVLVPAAHRPDHIRPVVSYQCAIDAVSSRCFPSLRDAPPRQAVGSLAQLEYLLVAARWPRAGGVRAGPRRPRRHVGRAFTSPVTACSTDCAPR